MTEKINNKCIVTDVSSKKCANTYNPKLTANEQSKISNDCVFNTNDKIFEKIQKEVKKDENTDNSLTKKDFINLEQTFNEGCKFSKKEIEGGLFEKTTCSDGRTLERIDSDNFQFLKYQSGKNSITAVSYEDYDHIEYQNNTKMKLYDYKLESSVGSNIKTAITNFSSVDSANPSANFNYHYEW